MAKYVGISLPTSYTAMQEDLFWLGLLQLFPKDSTELIHYIWGANFSNSGSYSLTDLQGLDYYKHIVIKVATTARSNEMLAYVSSLAQPSIKTRAIDEFGTYQVTWSTDALDTGVTDIMPGISTDLTTFDPTATNLYVNANNDIDVSLYGVPVGSTLDSLFWTAARNLSTSLATLWSTYPQQMADHGATVAAYRDYAYKESVNRVQSVTLANVADIPTSAGAVPMDTLDQIAADIAAGATRSDLITDYSGAALAYGSQIRDLIEGTFTTPNQQATALETLTTSLSNGTSLNDLLSTYGATMQTNPLAYLYWDRWAKTGMFPK